MLYLNERIYLILLTTLHKQKRNIQKKMTKEESWCALYCFLTKDPNPLACGTQEARLNLNSVESNGTCKEHISCCYCFGFTTVTTAGRQAAEYTGPKEEMGEGSRASEVTPFPSILSGFATHPSVLT